jgi:hypothetical protein
VFHCPIQPSIIRIHFLAFLLLATSLPVGAADEQKQAKDDWIQGYYQRPSPERFEAEVKKLQAAGALQKEEALAPAAAFFSRLFAAAEPPMLAKWLKFIDSLPAADQTVFLISLRWADTPETQDALQKRASGKTENAKRARSLLDSKAPKLDKISSPATGELDMCWGAFFATGDPVYALIVIRCAVQPEKSGEIDMSREAARWSLKSICKSHAKLREIKDNFRKTATPAEQKSLDELFKK